MKESTTSRKYLWFSLGVLLFIIIWFIISAVIDERTMIFPDPFTTVKETVVLLGKAYVYQCILHSLVRMLIGFGISFVLAMILGILAGNFPVIKTTLSPIMIVLKAIPTASLVFLFLVLMGAKNAPIMMVVLISLPILYEAISGGIENIDPLIMNAARIDGSRGLSTVFRIELPMILPYLIIGVASSFSLSFKIEIMSEIIAGDTRDGLGCAILAAQRTDPSNMTPIFAYSLIAIIVIFIISGLMKLIENIFKKKIRN